MDLAPPMAAGPGACKHWAAALVVLALDLCMALATIVLNKVHHVEAPAEGETNTSAAVGWVGVLGAIIAFGCYGILIKTPAVVEAKVDAMVFQVYFSISVALTLFLIWLVAASSEPMTLNGSSLGMGVIFALLWISSQVASYEAITRLGYAVGPAVWIGVTICGSFAWGCAAFRNPVGSAGGACLAILLLVTGACCAAMSSLWSDALKKQARQRLDPGSAPEEGEDHGEPGGSWRFALGLAASVFAGLCNGSLMVPMNCFEYGCAAIGVGAFLGQEPAPMAFLPSQSAGVLLVQPIMFAAYFGRQILAGRLPEFHFRIVALPGLLTGAFWAMGFFNAMFATLYLGQSIGLPLTQLCIVLNGLWGILYYQEISGIRPIGLFALGSVVLIAGAVLDGRYG